MADDNTEKIETYSFINNKKAKSIFAKLDYTLRNGTHIQREYPLNANLHRFLNESENYESLKNYYKDFFNLMDVYLDAVFFPNIYSNPDIFRQEGWHYELSGPDDDLNLKGVVYNEMEGAFSSPEQILFRSIRKALLPDTIYSHESGGDPDVIPNLTYEEFIAFHKKYYHPSNCKILLYGDGKIEEQLAFLNEGFLDQFQRKEMHFGSWIQDNIQEKTSIELVYPLSEEESEKDKAYLNLSFVTGSYLDPKTILGLEILDHILLGTPAAPLKNALLKAKIGKDIFGQFEEELLQPIFSITVKHTDPGKKGEFEKIVMDTLTSLVDNGLSERIVVAVSRVSMGS